MEKKLASIMAFSAIAFAEIPEPAFANNSQINSSPLIPGDPIEKNRLPVGYYYPAEYRIDNSSNLSVAGEFLYWASNKMVHDVALRTSDVITNKTLIHHAGYRPGLRFMLGAEIPRWDNFHLNLTYTRVHQETTTQHSASNGEKITPLSGVTFAPIPLTQNHVKSKFRFHIDFGDLVLSKSFYIGQRIILAPYFGLMGCRNRLDHHLNFNVIGYQRFQSHFWAIGPEGGFSVKGLLFGGLYATAKSDVSFPYLKQTRSVAITQVIGAENEIRKSDPERQFYQQAFMRSNIGLGWGTYFLNNEYHFDFSAAYEYWGTWILAVVKGGSVGDLPLEMQGYSFRASLDF